MDSTNGSRDDKVGYGGKEYWPQCSSGDGHCWILRQREKKRHEYKLQLRYTLPHMYVWMCRNRMMCEASRQDYIPLRRMTKAGCFLNQDFTRKQLGREKKNKLTYLQISRDVSSCLYARCGGEENGEHTKEAALLPPPVGHKIGGKDIRCWRWQSQFTGMLR